MVGSTQTSLHESVCHFRIGPHRGCGLGNGRLQAFPEQAVEADKKAVCQFCQLVHLVEQRPLALWTALALMSTVTMLAKLTPALAREATWVWSQEERKALEALRRRLLIEQTSMLDSKWSTAV